MSQPTPWNGNSPEWHTSPTRKGKPKFPASAKCSPVGIAGYGTGSVTVLQRPDKQDQMQLDRMDQRKPLPLSKTLAFIGKAAGSSVVASGEKVPAAPKKRHLAKSTVAVPGQDNTAKEQRSNPSKKQRRHPTKKPGSVSKKQSSSSPSKPGSVSKKQQGSSPTKQRSSSKKRRPTIDEGMTDDEWFQRVDWEMQHVSCLLFHLYLAFSA